MGLSSAEKGLDEEMVAAAMAAKVHDPAAARAIRRMLAHLPLRPSRS